MADGEALWREQARVALAAGGYDAAGRLTRVRLKPGQSVSYQSGSAFAKVYIGERTGTRAARAQVAQMRASTAGVSPRPGPVSEDAFAMDWLDVTPLGRALRLPWAARGRLLHDAGAALRAAHGGAGEGPLPFGGWPAKRMRMIADTTPNPPWPDFHAQAAAVADRLWQTREETSPAGFAHGDCHPGNMLVGRGGQISLIDFDSDERRPIIWDIANFLIALAAQTPGWRGGSAGPFGVARRDGDAFLSAFPELAGHERLLALHMLRFALRRGAAAGGRRGALGMRARQVARLEKVAGALSRELDI